MKLWQKEFVLHQQIEKFTVGKDRELDLELAAYDIWGSLAHGQMLSEVGLLSKAEFQDLQKELLNILEEVQQGKFIIEEGVEDVHSQVELLLTQKLGTIGKKIHAGRSRNDQVLVDIRLYLRTQIYQIHSLTEKVFNTLLEKSETHQDSFMPGYTHLQVGMVSSTGLWFGAFAESLVDDLQLLQAVHQIINQNPLGSAAGYGSSFPLNRQRTTDLLGFRQLNFNALHAQMGRGKTELFFAFALAGLGATLGKLATDICLYNSQNYGFFQLPNELTTGSSIMPHKKNPDVVELLRARCNQLQNLPAAISQLTGNLPAGYHRDFQLLKEMLFPAIEQCKEVLQLTDFLLNNLQVKKGLLKESKYDVLFSVDAINALVMQGMPFREAYQQVGREIEAGEYVRPEALEHTHEGSIGNLCNDQISKKMEAVIAGMGFEKWQKAIKHLLSTPDE